jgi:alpha-glucosidase
MPLEASLAHHDGSPLYASTVAPHLGDTLTLRLRTHRDHQPLQVILRTVRDGEPHVVRAEVSETVGQEVWWSVNLTVRNVATSYRWLLLGGAFDFLWLTAGGLRDYDVPDATDFVISATLPAPAWASSAVVYQVFPDRFARSHGDADGLAASPDGVDLPTWAVPRDWMDRPEGRSGNTSAEFFGGDLDGICERLDHVTGLGANVLYMTPFFPAGSTHRYDASSFDVVDPLLGGTPALKRLVNAAHGRGLRVIGDITLNHCGRDHEWFVSAQDPHAPEREFFSFDPALKYGYECWFNVPTLPKFDHTSARLRERLVTAESSPVRTWLRGPAGLDGWRVDVANMAGRMGSVDVTHEFARDVREAMALERGDSLLVAEHGHDASGDLLGDGWHGTMNYAGFTRQVWCWLRGPDFRETFMGLPVEVPVISGEQMVASVRAFHARIPWRSLIASWNILSSHDVARIRTVVGSAERQVAAIALAVGLPGVPMVFAGDEIGATGSWGEDARTPFPWNDEESWDRAMLATYSQLIGLRTSSAALATGGLRWLHVTSDSIAFVREHPQESVLMAVARNQSEEIRIPLTALNAASIQHVYGFDAQVVAGQVVISVPSAGAGVWRVEGEKSWPIWC